MERSDEARREDSLQNALGSAEQKNKDKRCQEEIMSDRAVDLLARNKQQAEKITELERIIVEAKECVKITQERNDNLKYLLDVAAIKLKSALSEIVDARKGAFGFIIKTDETLQQGMARNYNEFFEERLRLSKQVRFLKDMILQRQMGELCYCDKCVAIRGDTKQYRDKLEREIDDMLVVKEAQYGKSKALSNDT